MTTQARSSHEDQVQPLQWRDRLQQRAFHVIANKTLTGIRAPTRPTDSERQFVILAFMLGGLSIVTGFFPIAGLPIGLSGLIMGLVGRRILMLQRVATWAVALSVIGLVHTLANIIVIISIYLSSYLWQ